MKRLMITAGTAAMIFASAQSFANEFAPQLEELAKSEISTIVASPELVAAIKAQNEKNASLDDAKIDALDKKWRAEVGSSDAPTINEKLGRDASKMLASVREESAGLYTEIFVMDNKGLNVAQSDVTSDYWQGDEAKFTETYAKGAEAIHISEIEEDESTQTFQSQVSMTVVDPADGSPIGAITVGVNVEMLQ